jgi:hypothetical protein
MFFGFYFLKEKKPKKFGNCFLYFSKNLFRFTEGVKNKNRGWKEKFAKINGLGYGSPKCWLIIDRSQTDPI